MKIAVFGSAFNPPTYSHLKIIEHLTGLFDKVLVVPCYSHNFGKKMIAFQDRVAMARLLVNHITDKVEVSEIEANIFKTEISKTYLLLKALQRNAPDDVFVFVCGEDNGSPENWVKFYKYDLIDKEFSKYVMPDQGMTRSTLVREKLSRGESVIAHTKKEIVEYIEKNNIIF
jgi:nicotinate-nucleotide adenylyltransferase